MFSDYATSSDSDELQESIATSNDLDSAITDEPITCSTPVKEVPPSLSAKHALTPDSKAAADHSQNDFQQVSM
jgi:hypothetical protein